MTYFNNIIKHEHQLKEIIEKMKDKYFSNKGN